MLAEDLLLRVAAEARFHARDAWIDRRIQSKGSIIRWYVRNLEQIERFLSKVVTTTCFRAEEGSGGGADGEGTIRQRFCGLDVATTQRRRSFMTNGKAIQ